MKFAGLPLLLALAVSAVPVSSGKDKDKPSISLKANPVVAFSPARVVVTADIKGGPNDYEDFYCATVEWVWGDGTESSQVADCEPYEAGKSEIKRHFTVDHGYQSSGDFRVEFRLKKKGKVI